MRSISLISAVLCASFIIAGSSCVSAAGLSDDDRMEPQSTLFTKDTAVADVIGYPAFRDYGHLLFPTDVRYFSGSTLGELQLLYYSNITADDTVDVLNYLKKSAERGERIFYDIYTEDEKLADPSRKNTGLFFFRGEPGGRFAICNAGGAFAYVGAIHDSFPHALKLSERGYNAFALIYRPDAELACMDLARAISFIFSHASELNISTDCYSLWGGSAGARMAAWLGSYGTEPFGENALPRPGAVIMQYTGLSTYSELDPPTYACVGDMDWIASWRTMKSRLDAMKMLGIDTEFHVYPGLGHGFGIGTGTIAEGWVDDAVRFWQRQM